MGAIPVLKEVQRMSVSWPRSLVTICLVLFLVSCSHSGSSNLSLDSMEAIRLGGMVQYISIRGADAKNPILLWLHGGPGSSQMPVSHQYDSCLEEHFVVVHWDQRGAGKSNPKDFDETEMTLERYIGDCHELTAYLKQRFSREKIILAGHSWGSQLGLLTVSRYPQDYLLYIGVSQVVAPLEAHRIGEQWLRETLSEKERAKKLERLGPPPYLDHGDFVRFIHLIDANGGGFDVSFPSLVWTALHSPYYSPGDLVRWMQGANRGSGPMWEETLRFNAFQAVPELDIPALFISGSMDHNTPATLVGEYCERLQTRFKKKFVLFPEAAHTPFFQDGERFCREVLEFLEDIEPTGNDGF